MTFALSGWYSTSPIAKSVMRIALEGGLLRQERLAQLGVDEAARLLDLAPAQRLGVLALGVVEGGLAAHRVGRTR